MIKQHYLMLYIDYHSSAFFLNSQALQNSSTLNNTFLQNPDILDNDHSFQHLC